MVKRQGWLRRDALVVCEMYRHYLYLRRKYANQGRLPPSEDIDEFWHAHILDTKAYREDCRVIFGEYLDHYPYFGIDQNSTEEEVNASFEAMQRLYAAEFDGAELYQVRNIYSKGIGIFRKIFSPLAQRGIGEVEQVSI